MISKTQSTGVGSDYDWMHEQERRIFQYLDSNGIYAVDLDSYLWEQNLQLFSRNQTLVKKMREDGDTTSHKNPEKKSSFH